MNKTLFIDTSDSTKTIVGIIYGNKKKLLEEKSDPVTKSQNVLPMIKKILREEKIRMSDLTAIEVNTGPGSFTGIRVGVTVANTLAWILKIPVNGKKSVDPEYSVSKFDFKNR